MTAPPAKSRAARNRTLTVAADEADALSAETVRLTGPITAEALSGRVVHQDLFDALPHLPDAFVDLLIVDPPYNLSKTFAGSRFSKTGDAEYRDWLESWLAPLARCLKPQASVYLCCDWRSSGVVQSVLDRRFVIRNRITWEREKGRGAKSNWKNCSEDIWFCTLSDDYFFDVEAVKLRKKIVAPYRHDDGAPKDWEESGDGGGFRLTHPSNLWTDISIPFWSMPENTDHPTQKPEKLIAKLVLAGSRPGDFVFDPFLGSGTTAAVAKKLGRRFAGVEREAEYCRLAVKRLKLAETDRGVQGYRDGCFWERNSLNDQIRKTRSQKTK